MALLPYELPPDTHRGWWPINAPQATALVSPAKILLFGGASGGGKMLALDTPIPTPTGWTTMGELRAGEAVFGETGAPCRVTIAHGIVERPETFRVVFGDGSTFLACADHKWTTVDASTRKAIKNSGVVGYPSNWPSWSSHRGKRARTLTTREISETIDIKDGYKNHCIPVCEALQLPEANLEVDPFVMGAYLGDGTDCKGSSRMAADKKNGDHALMRSEFERRGYVTTNIADPFAFGILGLSKKMRELGVVARKHIPLKYLRGSESQRLDLLRGLMITDGTVTVAGQVMFENINETLADGVVELACSLGQKAKKYTLNRKTVAGNTAWRVYWTPTIDVFGLGRKSGRIKKRGAQIVRSMHRIIVSCEPCDPVPMRCITVDNPSGLYLAGHQMVPTHNTDLLVADGMQEIENPNFRGLLLRKSFTEMNNIIDRMMAIYRPLGGHPSDSGKIWKFPSGAQLRLGYLSADADVEKYQGSPFSWLGVDEAGNQLEKRFRAILPWLASTDPTLRVRARLTANPGGIGADWLMRLFLRDKCPIHFPEESAEPGSVYAGKKLTWTDGRPLDPRGKMTVSFIPSHVEDNPLYGEEKIAMLQSQEGPVAENLLMGCWCQLAGRYFSFMRPGLILPYAEHPSQWWNTHLISIDYGFGESWAAAALAYVSEPTMEWPEGRMFFIGEIVEQSMGSEDFAKKCLEVFLDSAGGAQRQITAAYCDPANDGHTGNGRSNMEIMGETFAGRDIPILASHKDRIANAQNAFRMIKKGQVVITDACPMLYKSFNTRMHDPKRPGDVKKIKGNPLDDCYDCGVYLINTYFSGEAKPLEVSQAEKIAAFKAAGMDEHSLGVNMFRMMMQQQDEEEPYRISNVGRARVISRG